MSIQYGEIDRKAEDAFGAFIALHSGAGKPLADITISKGFSGEELPTERIEVVCSEALADMAEEIDYILGNWYCTMSIAYYRHYKADREESSAKKAALFDLLMRDDVSEQLNNAGISNFYAINGEQGEGPGWEPQKISNEVSAGDEVRSMLTGVLYCQPSIPEQP